MTYQRIDESLAKGLADYYATAIEIEREKFERSIDKRRLFQISNRKTWYTAVVVNNIVRPGGFTIGLRRTIHCPWHHKDTPMYLIEK